MLHNLIFGCILVFLVQWIFLGNLRSAVIVGLNIPFALFFATILLVFMGESANLLSVGAVDFGIFVDSAVILVENVFRNFQRNEEEKKALLDRLADTLHALQQDAEALKAAAAAKDAAVITLDLTKKQLESGYVNYLSLLNAEQGYQQAELNLVQAHANRYADAAALFQALGGGWWNRNDIPKF